MTNKVTFHIIFNTFGAFPVWDRRGNWNELKNRYSTLSELGIDMKSEHDFPAEYQKTEPTNAISFEKEEIQFLTESIQHLTRENGDRVCGNMEIELLHVQPHFVELIVREEEALVLQKLSRLKSRLATLLSFEFPHRFSGKHTWSKGFWNARITGDVNRAITILSKRNR